MGLPKLRRRPRLAAWLAAVLLGGSAWPVLATIAADPDCEHCAAERLADPCGMSAGVAASADDEALPARRGPLPTPSVRVSEPPRPGAVVAAAAAQLGCRQRDRRQHHSGDPPTYLAVGRLLI
jgi:hypothetical protein